MPPRAVRCGWRVTGWTGGRRTERTGFPVPVHLASSFYDLAGFQAGLLTDAIVGPRTGL